MQPQSNRIPVDYFVNIEKLNLKCISRGTRPRISNVALKEDKVGGLTLPTSKLIIKFQ